MPTEATTSPRLYESAEMPAVLPNFCSVGAVFTVVLCAELLAFVFALAMPAREGGQWATLGLLSLFVQWVTLSCMALLCLLRPRLQRLGEAGAAIGAWGLIMSVTLLFSALAPYVDGVADRSLLGDLPGGEFMLRSLSIAGILASIVLRYFYVQAQNRRRLQAESQARLAALQARIRPHFMFNALNTIASLARSQPEVAEEMVEDLAELLRASLGDTARLMTLDEELDLARRYLSMETLRMGERLRYRFACTGLPRDLRVPALIVQPLVENAVYHGIEPLPAGGEVAVEGMCQGGVVTLTVSNPKRITPPRHGRRGHHMALDNIRERLRLHYGPSARLEVVDAGDAFQVSLIFPLHATEQARAAA
ncbi:MAG: sensor histidine kinase [Chromatiales bacterium]|jgi:two-component system sensor histidine kinase AlgZ|nr:sensor histidine kinase [Chromatiales bacterium]